jgi:eukaryotic-like serine/threonine-protein kinase
MTPSPSPDPQRWQVLEELFYAASDMEAVDRVGFLHRACGDDSALCEEVQSLLASSGESTQFLRRPVVEAAQQLSSSTTLTGKRVGPYHVLQTIGEGGMGNVYLASRADETYDQKVAIKVVRGGFGQDPQMLRRFRTERQILANLNHPNIARLLDGGVTAEGLPYLVMDYVEGISIDDFCARNRLTTTGRLQLFQTVCAAVEYAHRNLIIHRDIKPANILVTPEGVPKLLDFGIAKLLDPETVDLTSAPTRATERVLTPEYASPEQVRGEPVTTAADVYGLGVLLYELLAGTRPFRVKTDNPFEVARVICEQIPPPPSAVSLDHPDFAPPDRRKLKGDLDNIVLMAMRKEPERRYASATALSADVRAYLNGQPLQARTDTWSYRSGRFIQRHKPAVAAAVIVMLALIGFSIGMGLLATRAARERQIAERESQFLAHMFEASTPDQARGETITARMLLDKGAQQIDRELPSEPEVRASLLGTIAGAYRSLGLFDQASSLARRSYDLANKTLGEKDSETQNDLELLAELSRDKGQYSEAEPILTKLAAIRRKTLGENNPLVARTLGELGECFYWEAKDDQAISILQQALAIDKRAGPDYGAGDRNYLALALERKGDFDEARQFLQESVDINRRNPGIYSQDYAISLSNLGSALIDRGDLSGAESKLRESLAIRRKILGPGHPDLIYSLNNLGYVLLERGDWQPAEPYIKEALDISLLRLGANHPRVATEMNNWARVLQAKGNYVEARKNFQQALDIVQHSNRPATWPAAQITANLGLLYFDWGNYPAAEKYARQALEMRRSLGGEQTPAFASSLIEVAEDRTFQNDPAGAEPLLRRALEVRRQRLPSGHPAIIMAEIRLGESLMAQDNAKEASPLLSDAVSSTRASPFPLPVWQLGEANSAYGVCLKALGRGREGDILLRESRASLISDPRPAFRTQASDRIRFRGNAKALQP